ncbi:MAG: YchJ family protein [Caldilineaceae bacterium]|nr:YchJ family protein [Caldilineaceae bacterium]MCB0096059.1 YchJ family protein [Caldilineaceae bacterium]MCB9157018.1 YchJ family protein [Caldilineaceae bacterium]
MDKNSCPCGSRKEYAECCQAFLNGAAFAHTPEQLMRSRYTAFHQGNIDYLLATQHPAQRQPDARQTLAETVSQTEWLSLRVLNAVGNTVEFVAFYRQDSHLNQLHEVSQFVREDGRWFYTTGAHLMPIQLGRNDPCWCGSGKKRKKCHG